MGAGLDDGLRLSQVLGGIHDGGFEPVPGLVQAAGNLGDGVQEDVGLVQALLCGADGHGGKASFTGRQLFAGSRAGILHEREALLGLRDVVRYLDKRAVGVLAAQVRQRLFRLGDFRVGLDRPGIHGGQRLGRVLFEFAERVEVRFLFLQGSEGGFGAADDLAQPAALLLFCVRDMVVQLLLQLERLGHVGLRFLKRLGEIPDGGVAVLGLRKPKFLLAGLDGVVGLNEQRAALAAQLLDTQRSERIKLGALRSIAGAGRLGLLPPVPEVEIGSCTAGGHNTGANENRSTGAAGGNSAAPAASRIANG
ncbi:hypothetical protein SRABI83_00588 [Arthrobacter sp. Bi83]|nr:hypothetical protein SRABI83_00588 [Arthrobacter sp. Bi83]